MKQEIVLVIGKKCRVISFSLIHETVKAKNTSLVECHALYCFVWVFTVCQITWGGFPVNSGVKYPSYTL